MKTGSDSSGSSMSKYAVREALINFGIVFGVILVAVLALALLWYATFVTNIDRHELGFSYDRFTGQIETFDRFGWWVRTPIRYSVHAIDTRPYQISISANQRILNAKLVRFNPNGLSKFIEWHGRSAGDDHNNLLEILKCYAFDRDDGKDCPFLEVVSEIAPSQGAPGQVTNRTAHLELK